MSSSLDRPLDPAGYEILAREINSAAERSQSEWADLMRLYCRFDLYFLLRFGLSWGRDIKLSNGSAWVEHPWTFDYVREIEADHHNVCDIGARFSGKSTIKLALLIQKALRNPNTGIGIFSVKKSLAINNHLSRIKQELEGNELLRTIYDDILYWDPNNQGKDGSSQWSLTEGLRLKRTTTRGENTFETSGFLDSQQVGKHYDVLYFDDCEDKDSVTTEEQRSKAINAWELSLALRSNRVEYIYTGTYYHHASLYMALEQKGIRIRKRPAAEMARMPEGVDEYDVAGEVRVAGGKMRSVTFKELGGYPVLETPQGLAEICVLWGKQHYGQQMMCDASAGGASTLNIKLVNFYEENPRFAGKRCVRYLLVDPANSKKAGSDRTAMVVVGLGPDRNLYVLDMLKLPLNPSERIEQAFRLHKKWAPLREVRWEEVGLASDVHHMKERQRTDSYRFRVTSISASWKNKPDDAVVSFLEPLLAEGRFYVPRIMMVEDEYGEEHNMAEELVQEEMKTFPLGKENHLLHAIALLNERKGVPPLLWPAADHRETEPQDRWREELRNRRYGSSGKTWMAAT